MPTETRHIRQLRGDLAAAQSEAAFQADVVAYAHAHGWLVMHTRPARTARGWRTAIQGDAGFPDLVLARHGRVLHVELKAETGRLTPQQAVWSAALGESWRLWRPRHWYDGTIDKELQ